MQRPRQTECRAPYRRHFPLEVPVKLQNVETSLFRKFVTKSSHTALTLREANKFPFWKSGERQNISQKGSVAILIVGPLWGDAEGEMADFPTNRNKLERYVKRSPSHQILQLTVKLRANWDKQNTNPSFPENRFWETRLFSEPTEIFLLRKNQPTLLQWASGRTNRWTNERTNRQTDIFRYSYLLVIWPTPLGGPQRLPV